MRRLFTCVGSAYALKATVYMNQ